MEEALEIQSFGFYRPRYGFASSDEYAERLRGLRDRQKQTIKDGEATWRPAFDLNRTILVGQIIAIVALLVTRSVVKTLARARR